LKTTIVTTTINVPLALERYAENARFYGHSDLAFLVIGDRKTPSETRDFCAGLGSRCYPCEYLGLDDQRQYLQKYPSLWDHLPFDSIQRRNIGLLKAWEDGADVVITVDDDNWMLNHDFVRLHGVVGQSPELPSIESTSGWFNVCSVLEEATGKPFYHRGYPRGERWRESDGFTCTSLVRRRVAVNAGLWLDDPDIDAMTRIEHPIVVRGVRAAAPSRFALQPGTWSPFNSQNTGLARDVIPAYFLSPYVGRYDDIWPSYIVTRIANHLGEVIAYGEPLLRQKRNQHDLWRDLDAERVGMLLTDEFCAALRSITLRGQNYGQCYAEITDQLTQVWKPGNKWSPAMLDARERLLLGMAVWCEVFARFSAPSNTITRDRVDAMCHTAPGQRSVASNKPS
jgi:hypothetical protein